MQVFICYSRTDTAFARKLVTDLTAYEVQVWMDVRNIPHGSNWDMEVQKGLDSSDLMLVLLSPASAASSNVADEWSYFIEKNKPIVPLLVINCEVPFRLSRRQRVDFTNDYQVGFDQLLTALDVSDPEKTEQIRPVQFRPGTPAPRNSTSGAAVTGAPAVPAKPRGPQDPGASTEFRSQPDSSHSATNNANVGANRNSNNGLPSAHPAVDPRTESRSERHVEIKRLPMVWAKAYHWFKGLQDGLMDGDVVINDREMVLIPRTSPVVTIPLRSIISAHVKRSVDQYLHLTYYSADGKQLSLILMGRSMRKRRQLNEQVLKQLQEQTGRTLDQ